MADNQLDIEINLGLAKNRAPEAVKELEKVQVAQKKLRDDSEAYQKRLGEMFDKEHAAKVQQWQDAEKLKAEQAAAAEAAAAAAQAGVKQEELVTEATKKTFTSKKQLKDMVKELGQQFPVLGQLGRLALNPIAFTTAAITSAFVLWNQRVKELTRSLGGIEMPDVSTTATEQIEANAAAWGRMAQAMADAANASGRIKTDLDQTLSTIKANEELFAAWGFDTGSTGNEQRVAAMGSAAAGLRASGRARIARAGTPGSKEAEDVLAGKFNASVVSAEAAKKESQGRLDDILGIGDLRGPKRVMANARFLSRYGTMSVEEAADLERGNIASQQGLIDQAGRFALSRADRSVRRSEIAGGMEDLAKAKAVNEQMVELLRQIAASVAGRAPRPGAPNGVDELPAFIQGVGQFMANFPATMAAIERANATQASVIRTMSQRP